MKNFFTIVPKYVNELNQACLGDNQHVYKLLEFINESDVDICSVIKDIQINGGDYKLAFIATLMKVGKYVPALAEIDNILQYSIVHSELHPRILLTKINILNLLGKFDQLSEALSCIESIDLYQNEDIKIAFLSAKITTLVKLGRYGEAVEIFHKLNELDQVLNTHNVSKITEFINREEYVNYLHFLVESETDQYNKAFYLNTIAWILKEISEKYEYALKCINIALSIIPDQANFIHTKASLLSNSGNSVNYIESLELYNKLINDRPIIYYYLGRAELYGKMANFTYASRDYYLIQKKLDEQKWSDMINGNVDSVVEAMKKVEL